MIIVYITHDSRASAGDTDSSVGSRAVTNQILCLEHDLDRSRDGKAFIKGHIACKDNCLDAVFVQREIEIISIIDRQSTGSIVLYRNGMQRILKRNRVSIFCVRHRESGYLTVFSVQERLADERPCGIAVDDL